ncbi:hypothetical protein [Enterococcus sp. DIV0187]|uniref:hypothetical protein n=1 Tax=Enterococcus sp. DIV0187 TaxID=2774644 RepID=UPI003F287C0A
MSKESLTLAEKEKCRIEIEMKERYYGSFVTNILNRKQREKFVLYKDKNNEKD